MVKKTQSAQGGGVVIPGLSLVLGLWKPCSVSEVGLDQKCIENEIRRAYDFPYIAQQDRKNVSSSLISKKYYN